MANLVLAAEHAAVPESAVKHGLGKDADQVLDDIVKAKLLSYRPKSCWARDLPTKVHGPKGKPIVTAPTPAHLYCMKKLQECGDLVPSESTAQDCRVWQ